MKRINWQLDEIMGGLLVGDFDLLNREWDMDRRMNSGWMDTGGGLLKMYRGGGNDRVINREPSLAWPTRSFVFLCLSIINVIAPSDRSPCTTNGGVNKIK